MTTTADGLVLDGGSAARPDFALVSGRPLLAGRTVMLTGAGGGIGRFVAHALVAAGARVALADLDPRSLATVVGQLPAHAQLHTTAFDASSFDAFRAFHDETVAALGDVDGLVNCAGLWSARGYEDVTAAEWEAMIEANLSSAFAGCKAVLPHMSARGGGSVVNVSSTAGEFGSISPGAHYAAAKGGVIALTKSLAREVGRFNVRVNTVSPGPTDTIALGAATAEQKATAGARTLFGRLGRPEEVAYGCVYLLSDLSTFVTGQVLGVNGGSRL